MNVVEYLNRHHVPFEQWDHRTTFTAQHLAQAVHVPGDIVAKTVLLKAGDRFVVAVLQATHEIDLDRAAKALGVPRVTLVDEHDVFDQFPDCEPGVVPPFGSSYGMETLVDESLTDDEYIVFESNAHDEAISMHYRDYEHLERPQVAEFTHHV